MSWTTPTVRATGDLVTASIWNTDIVSNLKWLGLGDAILTSPPGSPVRYQRWIYQLSGGEHWSFVYRDDLDGTYPWHFIGGPPLENDTTGTTATVTVPRAGVYVAWGGGHATVSGGGDASVASPSATSAWGANFAAGFGSITATKAASSTFTTTRAGTTSPAGAVSVACLPKKIS